MGGKQLRGMWVIGTLILALLSAQLVQSASREIEPLLPPLFGPVLFSSAFDRDTQQPVDVNSIFPAQTSSVFAYWAYSGVRAGQSYTFEWYRNGTLLSSGEDTFRSALGYAWHKYAQQSGWPLRPGIYEFVVRIDGQVVIHEQCLISGAYVEGVSEPAFTYVTMGSNFDERSLQPFNTGWQLPYGIARLYVYWPFSGQHPDSTFTYKWLLNGELLTSGEGHFTTSADFSWTSIYYASGEPLPPGRYQFVLETGGQEVPLRDNYCTVVSESPFFGSVAFASDFDDDAQKPVDPDSAFRGTVTRLYAYWPYSGVRTEDTFDYAWYHNGERFHGGRGTFGAEHGYAWQWIFHDDGTPLQPGLYQFYVTVNDRTVIARQAIIEGDGVESQSSPDAVSRPAFGPLVFSTLFDSGTQTPINPGWQFEYGANALYGYWSYQNVQVGDTFRYEWSHNGQFFSGGEDTFKQTAGSAWQWAVRPDAAALYPGNYQLSITVNGDTVLADTCIILMPHRPESGPYGYGY